MNPVFWHQPAAERLLREAVKAGRLPRTLLLAGPDGTGKWAAAIWIAQSLLCRQRRDGQPCGNCRDCARVANTSHPDLHIIFPVPSKTAEESEEEFLRAKLAEPFAVVRFDKRPYITLERIRGLISELHRTSVEGGSKVTILYSAEQTKDDNSQSVLLKTIEEPPTDAYFILTSAAPERLLPTILSRCQIVRFVPVDQEVVTHRLVEEKALDRTEADTISRLCAGGWGNALRLAGEDHQNWRKLMIELWKGAFQVRFPQLAEQIDSIFKRKVGFELILHAFDVWALCLWRDCRELAEPSSSRQTGTPISDLESAWSCWRILHNGRAAIYVNVSDRLAVTGTFLALRRRLGA